VKLSPIATAIFCGAVAVCQTARTQDAQHSSHSTTAKSSEAAFSHTLPTMDGSHLKAQVIEVTYRPGESTPPHSHPCPVVGYVIEGAVRNAG
jgi:quercetin dioxygenase-like cupin family protein